jgi:hypothetical protein
MCVRCAHTACSFTCICSNITSVRVLVLVVLILILALVVLPIILVVLVLALVLVAIVVLGVLVLVLVILILRPPVSSLFCRWRRCCNSTGSASSTQREADLQGLCFQCLDTDPHRATRQKTKSRQTTTSRPDPLLLRCKRHLFVGNNARRRPNCVL